ncbi:unnamed protein product [Boreogadus saida]
MRDALRRGTLLSQHIRPYIHTARLLALLRAGGTTTAHRYVGDMTKPGGARGLLFLMFANQGPLITGALGTTAAAESNRASASESCLQNEEISNTVWTPGLTEQSGPQRSLRGPRPPRCSEAGPRRISEPVFVTLFGGRRQTAPQPTSLR